MLEEADQCSEGTSAFPLLTTQDEEFSMLRRIIGARKSKMQRTKSFIRTQQAAIDEVLDPGIPEVFKMKEEPAIKSQLKSSRFANLQKRRSEISKHRAPHDLYKPDSHDIICVKEVREKEQQVKKQQEKVNGVVRGEVTQGEDSRPLKSLHWRALGQRHNCEGNQSCEKCKRILEVKKVAERFEAIRAAKQVLQESKSEAKADDEEGDELGESLQKIKREERFCRNTPVPNARTVVQKSKTTAGEDVSCVLIGGKWAQPVLSEMPKGVYRGRPFNHSQRSSTPRPVDGEMEKERDRRSSLSGVSKLKFIREYMDDEPDFESEEITSSDLAPRSQTDIVFTLPCSYERRFVRPRPIRPRILLLDMTCEEIDEKPTSSSENGSGITYFRKFISGKSSVLTSSGTECDSWCDNVISTQELEEKRPR